MAAPVFEDLNFLWESLAAFIRPVALTIRCGMKNSCSLSASPALFGDPCPGTPKYLEAHYQCVPEPSTVHLSRWSPDNRDEDPQNTLSCFPTEARGLFWNWTRAGHVALHKCPGGGTGRVKWRCDAVTVQWVPETPDFSDCSSQWVENIKYRIARGDPITSLAAELAVITRTKALMAGDIVHSADILHRLVTEMGERTRVMDDPQQRQRVLLALLESVLAVSSNLLDDSQRLPWQDLNREQQQKSAAALLRSQEKSGWLLAESHHSRYSLRSGQPHVSYQLNEEAERTERPIRRLSKVMYGSTCADMQVDVMKECLSSIKHVVGVRSVFLAKRLHAV
ncbi:latrophilin Cirl [Trichonephila clavipes]|nr:latrophilin Cirl [Trichonephila clavipes]